MNVVGDFAVDAHGGLERWREVGNLEVRVSLTGPTYAIKGQPQGTRDVLMRVNAREPGVTVSPFGGAGFVGRFRPERTWITDRTGEAIEGRIDRRACFLSYPDIVASVIEKATAQ